MAGCRPVLVRLALTTLSYLPCMLRAAVLAGHGLQDGALLTAAIWGVLVGLHLRGAAWWVGGWVGELDLQTHPWFLTAARERSLLIK